VNGVETWAQFRTRIREAIIRIRSEAAKSSSSVAFTSGGPIAATVSLALDLPPHKAIEFVWMSRNGSYSEFLFSGERFSLSSFNSFPHLDNRELLTYR
jgi:broad specificity phosphatase PhoE